MVEHSETLTTLERVFGISKFRMGQEEIIDSVLSHRNTLAVMPTGSGKSLCYQLPALLTPGLTLVVCPLIALMKDQVDVLVSRGVAAAYLHSGVDFSGQQQIYEDVLSSRIKILFVAPERFRNASFQSLLGTVGVSLLAVDEAHCISQWGHDFRPDYRRIGELRAELRFPPTIALTATASPEVQEDIISQLGLKEPSIHILGFDRPNLLFKVRIFRTQRQKLEYALDFIRSTIPMGSGEENPIKGCGLLYASTRKQAEEAVAYFRENGVYAGLYHAGLSDAERTRAQERFMNDDFHCLVATTAFGMGVDKPDIRYVIHLSMSSSIEAYTQESGRAGRDRKPSQCILLYTPQDMKIQEFFIENSYPSKEMFEDICRVFSDLEKVASDPVVLSVQELRQRMELKRKSGLDTALRKLRSLGFLDFSSDEVILWKASPSSKELKEIYTEIKQQRRAAQKRLKDLMSYVYTQDCRTKFILKYFGSREIKSFKRCYHCDLCSVSYPVKRATDDVAFPPEPLHFVLLKILSTVARQNGNLNSSQVAQVLAGMREGVDKSLVEMSTFSLLSYFPQEEIKVLCALLSDAELLATHRSVLGLTSLGSRCLSAKDLSVFPEPLVNFLQQRYPKSLSRGVAFKNRD